MSADQITLHILITLIINLLEKNIGCVAWNIVSFSGQAISKKTVNFMFFS